MKGLNSQRDQSTSTRSRQPQWTRTSLISRDGTSSQVSDLNVWSSLPISLADSKDFLGGPKGLLEILPQPQLQENNQSPDVVIIFTPGNPGLVEFYQSFLTKLFNKLQSRSISTVIVSSSHLSHQIQYSSSWSQTISHLCNSLQVLTHNIKMNWWPGALNHDKDGQDSIPLNQQVDYHTNLFKEVYASFDVEHSTRKPKFVLIGHSVGAYIATKVMERNAEKVDHLIGLFPTISQIGKTKNAASLNPLFCPFNLPIINFLQLFIILMVPRWVLIQVLKRGPKFFSINSNKSVVKGSEDEEFNSRVMVQLLVNPHLVSSVLNMARSEMKTIETLDSGFLNTFRSRLTFYYTSAEQDSWILEDEILKISKIFGVQSSSRSFSIAPVDHTFDSKLPNQTCDVVSHQSQLSESESTNQIGSNIIRSTEEIPHAFCLDHSEPMAVHCTQWIQSILDKA